MLKVKILSKVSSLLLEITYLKLLLTFYDTFYATIIRYGKFHGIKPQSFW